MNAFQRAAARGRAKRDARRAAEQPRNWHATQEFVVEAKAVADMLERIAQTIRDATHDETTRSGYRDQADRDAISNILGYAQLATENTRRFDGGRLASEIL